MSCCSPESCSKESACDTKCGGPCGKLCGMVTGILRIALGAAWIFFGVSKFGADADKIDFIGSAAAKLFPFLDFLSTSVWFWVAAITQILIGLVLLSGCRKLVKCAAVISLVMLTFITHTAGGWLNMDSTATGVMMYVPVILAAIGTMIVYKGGGSLVLCPMPCCKSGKCGTSSCSTESCSKTNDEEIIDV